jgi:hypothetical protein
LKHSNAALRGDLTNSSATGAHYSVGGEVHLIPPRANRHIGDMVMTVLAGNRSAKILFRVTSITSKAAMLTTIIPMTNLP